MVAYYTIAGRQVGSHVLAITTLNSLATISWLATRNGNKQPQTTPPLNAGSKDEENFIQEFLQQVEQEDKKNKISGKEAH